MEEVVVAALDHVDGVDLHIADMFDRDRDRSRSLADRRCRVQALCLQPDAARQGFGQEVGFGLAGHSPGTYPDSASHAAGRPGYRLPRPTILPVETSGDSQDALPRSATEHL